MIEPPIVSIIIPTFNYAKYVAEAVESALAQSYKSIEIIVVDDGSTDNTKEILAEYFDRIRYVYQTNSGLSAARNTGIRNASGNYVAFLDSDDLFHPKKIELQILALGQEIDIEVIASQSISGLHPDWIAISDKESDYCKITLKDLVLHTRFSPSSVLIKKSCFDNVGYFDTSLKSVEDRDMWIRLASEHRIIRLSSRLCFSRNTPGSMSKDPYKMEHFEKIVIQKSFSIPTLKHRVFLYRKSLSFCYIASALLLLNSGNKFAALKRIAISFLYTPIFVAENYHGVLFIRPRIIYQILIRSLGSLFSNFLRRWKYNK